MNYRSETVYLLVVLILTLVMVAGCAVSQETSSEFQITPDRQAALDSISPESMLHSGEVRPENFRFSS